MQTVPELQSSRGASSSWSSTKSATATAWLAKTAGATRPRVPRACRAAGRAGLEMAEGFCREAASFLAKAWKVARAAAGSSTLLKALQCNTAESGSKVVGTQLKEEAGLPIKAWKVAGAAAGLWLLKLHARNSNGLPGPMGLPEALLGAAPDLGFCNTIL